MGRRGGRTRNIRLLGVGLFIVLAWAGLGYRLVRVQAIEADTYASTGFDQRLSDEELPASRGTIYDRDGVELAVTVDAVTIVADPSLIEDPELVSRHLAPIVGQDEAELRARLEGEGRFAYVARAIPREDGDTIGELVEELELTGLSFLTEPRRAYPAGSLASQVVGFVRADTQEGLEGLELALDEELTGVAGSQIVERDRYGIPIPQGVFVLEPPEPGSDVVLTIDREIQYLAEQHLDEALETTRAAAGTIVVLDVDTGEVLAMASAPGFDPNDRAAISAETVRNRAVSDVYEPGSTLKVVTVAAALEEDVVSPATRYEVPTELQIHDKVYTDVERESPEMMTVADIVSRSSNIGTIMIQQELGNERHHQYLTRFGLGAVTHVGLPGEAPGQLHPVREWCETTCGPNTAIGYRVGVTPLQMATVFAAIANDGVWVQPHVVKEIIAADGERITPKEVERPVLSRRTARTMQLLLRGVVETGTGRRAAVDGYLVGGKTGTTEKWVPGVGYSSTDRIASFIGIAPIDAPEIVVAVVLDSPHGEASGESEAGGDEQTKLEFGGVSAAPVFAEVTKATLHQLGVAPHGG